MAETKVDKKERKTLKVKWVGEPQPLYKDSKTTVLRFNCEDNLQYETFFQALFPHITVGAELDADTELRITTTDDNKQYPHWMVVQIYKGGEPVAKPMSYAKPAGRGKSPGEIRSIEKQVSLYCAKDIAVASTKEGMHPSVKGILGMADDFYNWLKGGQDVKTETPKEHETDDPAEVLKPEDGPEVSWESVRPTLGELLNEKKWTIDGFLEKLADLGADVSSKNTKPAFESLNLENKRKFAKIITAKKED